MPQELKMGGLVLFRRLLKDAAPILGEIMIVGIGAIAVRIGFPGSPDERDVIVFENEICKIF